MKREISGSLLLVTALVLLGTAACKPNGKTTQITSSGHGRLISAAFDVPAFFRNQHGDHIISFGAHKLVLTSGMLVVDGDKWTFGIPADTSKVEINVQRGILTIKLIQTTV
jgi:hypothetical protein